MLYVIKHLKTGKFIAIEENTNYLFAVDQPEYATIYDSRISNPFNLINLIVKEKVLDIPLLMQSEEKEFLAFEVEMILKNTIKLENTPLLENKQNEL